MNIEKVLLKSMRYPYAVNVQSIAGRTRVLIATELEGPCTAIWTDTWEQEEIWTGYGGTMNTCQITSTGDFLAIQNFFKGFQSSSARLVWMYKKQEKWEMAEAARIPFLHRFCTVRLNNAIYVVCCQLCRDKKSREDWSHPGRVLVGKLPKEPGPICQWDTVLDGIHKNHGLYFGEMDGAPSILVSGEEGLFRCVPSDPAANGWHWEHLLPHPISDCTVIDLDDDGQDELITIEPFHGDTIVIYHRTAGQWLRVYQYPCRFGHAIWSGVLLGKPSFLIGYRGDNAALLLFQLRTIHTDGDWMMDVTVIDEHEAPTNVAVVPGKNCAHLFCCSGAKDRFVRYDLRE